MESGHPLISVIVPCYNQAQYLDECLQSVLAQTYLHWECIIVNDGSPDNTAEVAAKWLEKDSRFIYVEKENGGLSSARNAGLQKASGEWLQFLDCDDTLEPDKFEKSLSSIQSESVFITQFSLLMQTGKRPGYNVLRSEMMTFQNILCDWGINFTIPIHCGLIHKKLLRDFAFDLTVQSMEDWLLWLHIFHQNPAVKIINQPLANYRKQDSKSMSADLYGLIQQRIKILPTIKTVYGEQFHDLLVYSLYENAAHTSLQAKRELQKFQKDILVSFYWKLKAFLMKLLNI